MPKRDMYEPGTPCWADLISTNPAAAREFYSGLFGWQWSGPDVPGGGRYWTAMLEGDPVAGMPDGESSRPSTWLTYVSVADCDAATATALEAGAELVAEPLDVGPAGRRSFISDPSGALLGLWQAGEHVGASRTAEHGAMIWNEVYAVETEAVAAFYAALFGWTIGSMPTPQGEYTTFNLGDTMTGGTAPPPRQDMAAHWHVWFGSDDVPGTAARVAELGGSVVVEPTDFGGGHYASCVDPAGAVFSVITPQTG